MNLNMNNVISSVLDSVAIINKNSSDHWKSTNLIITGFSKPARGWLSNQEHLDTKM